MLVSLYKCSSDYPRTFYPPSLYPEFVEARIHSKFDGENQIFEAVRASFLQLGFDRENFGTKNWNPLSEIIKKGDLVLLKPNLVKHQHKRKDGSLLELITHPSIIKAVMDYVILALKGKGRIIIGDAPIQEAEIGKIKEFLRLKELFAGYEKYPNIKIEFIDFRREMAVTETYREIRRQPLPGDPRGYSVIDLGERSAFYGNSDRYEDYRVTNYDKTKMLNYHSSKKHAYEIANSVLDANVIISLPKLKTHRTAGMTCALKNVIGIIGSKYCLPHYRKRSAEEGGDEYLHKSIRKKLLSNIDEKLGSSRNRFFCYFLNSLKLFLYLSKKIKKFSDPYTKGNWYGNKTVCSTTIDVNEIIFFVDRNGKLKCPEKKRNLLILTDAIVSGEKEGPLNPTRKDTGFLITSKDPISNDLVVSYLMGFDPEKIPILMKSLNADINTNNIQDISNIPIISNLTNCQSINDILKGFNQKFIPSNGWIGYIEYST